MKVTQITAVVENSYMGETSTPNDSATIYGLGDDNKMYVWARTWTGKREEFDEEEQRNVKIDVYKFEWKPVEW